MSGPVKADFSLPLRKRRRPALSCVECRRRKIKCDRGEPCAHCKKSAGIKCVYSKNDHPASGNRQRSASNLPTASTSSQNPEISGNNEAAAAAPNQKPNVFLTESFPRPAGVSEENAYAETECCNSTALPTVHSSLFGQKDPSPLDSSWPGEKKLPNAPIRLCHAMGISFSTTNDIVIHDGNGKAKLRTKIAHQSDLKMCMYGQSHWKHSLALVNGINFQIDNLELANTYCSSTK